MELQRSHVRNVAHPIEFRSILKIQFQTRETRLPPFSCSVVPKLSTLYRSCRVISARSAFRFMQIVEVGIEFTDKKIESVQDLLDLFLTANNFGIYLKHCPN